MRKITENKIILSLLALFLFVSGWAIFLESLTTKEKLSPAPKTEKKRSGRALIVPLKEGRGQVVFDSGNTAVAGVDMIIRYDPQSIKIGGLSLNRELFAQIGQTSQEGKIKITGFLPKKMITGRQELAVFDYRLLTDQPAVLGLEFSQGETNDSNLIAWQNGQDILGEVIPLRFK